MAEVTVSQFAEVLKVPVDRLLVQLDQAGIKVAGPDDRISDDAKLELLTHLRRSHGSGESGNAAPSKITLSRKSQQEIKLSSGQGRARTVNVEVRTKRTYIKRDVLQEKARVQQDEIDSKRREAEEAVQRETERVEAERLERERVENDARRRVEEEVARKKAEEEAQRLAAQAAREEEERRAREREEALKRPPDAEAPKRVAEPPKKAPEPPAKPVFDPTFQRPQFIPPIQTRERPHQAATSSAPQRKGAPQPNKPAPQPQQAAAAPAPAPQQARPAASAPPSRPPGAPGSPDANTRYGRQELHVAGDVSSRYKKKRRMKGRPMQSASEGGKHGFEMPTAPVVREVSVGETVTVADLAQKMAIKATDVVVLVVAGDDGVMPQTIEAIQHARAAGVPIVVAVNKMDKPDADLDRVRQELAKHDVIPEDWGGENIFVPVSARTGAGVDQLLESILLVAEVLELRAPREGLASGIVIESSVEKGRGAVATVLVKKGTLHTGDPIIAGSEFGRVRAMFDENGKAVEEATPSMPVQVLGLSSPPNAGDEFLAAESERKAREVALYRQGKFRDVKLASRATRAEDVFSQMGEAKIGIVAVLIKADVQGSAEALRESLLKLSTDEVQVKLIASGLGGITESDVQLAAASKGLIIGFNVRADSGAREAIKETGVEVRYYSIIYEAIDDVKAMLSGMLKPEIKETILGVAQVRDVFRSSKFGVVAGCLITEGVVKRNNPIRVLRENVVIFEGALESLRRFKDDVGEVRAGVECGIGVRNYQDVRAGDQIECFSRVEIARALE